MPDYDHIEYRLRLHTKRTDLPTDVLRDIGEAYAEIARLRTELASAARQADYFQRDRDREQGDGDAARRERDEAQIERANLQETERGAK